MEEKYQIIIGINSFHRYEKLINLINSIEEQETTIKYKIIVIDDCSPDDRYLELPKISKHLILRNEINNGKKKYYLTINKLLKEVKKYDFEFFVQLDDDHLICKNFLNNIFNIINKKLVNQNFAMSLHLSSEKDLIYDRWGLSLNWVDGGSVYSKNCLEKLNFEILEIPESRWDNNELLSSGVWQQVSKRINFISGFILKPSISFLLNNDDNCSKMNPKIWIIQPIQTYNFIDTSEIKLEDIIYFNDSVKSNALKEVKKVGLVRNNNESPKSSINTNLKENKVENKVNKSNILQLNRVKKIINTRRL